MAVLPAAAAVLEGEPPASDRGVGRRGASRRGDLPRPLRSHRPPPVGLSDRRRRRPRPGRGPGAGELPPRAPRRGRPPRPPPPPGLPVPHRHQPAPRPPALAPPPARGGAGRDAGGRRSSKAAPRSSTPRTCAATSGASSPGSSRGPASSSGWPTSRAGATPISPPRWASRRPACGCSCSAPGSASPRCFGPRATRPRGADHERDFALPARRRRPRRRDQRRRRRVVRRSPGGVRLVRRRRPGPRLPRRRRRGVGGDRSGCPEPRRCCGAPPAATASAPSPAPSSPSGSPSASPCLAGAAGAALAAVRLGPAAWDRLAALGSAAASHPQASAGPLARRRRRPALDPGDRDLHLVAGCGVARRPPRRRYLQAPRMTPMAANETVR